MTIQKTGTHEYTLRINDLTATITDERVAKNPFRLKINGSLHGFYPDLLTAIRTVVAVVA